MLIEKLVDALGSKVVITDSSAMSNYYFDWTGRYSSQPIAVLKPTSTEEVAIALQICSSEKVAVVPQGGNSGLVGGSVGDERPHVILSTKELRTEPQFDSASNQLTLGAGFTLQEVQEIAKSYGLSYPVDTPSRSLATIGGNVATNAGGVRVIAFGMTASHVVGVRMVLSDGTIINRLNRLKKENTGFDFTALAIGSEGTLGVITEVCLQLSLPREVQWTGLIPCASLEVALSLATPLQSQLLAAEVFQGYAANQVASAEGMKTLPEGIEWWLLLEGDGPKPELPTGTLWAMSPAEELKFWNYRELQAAMLNRLNNVAKIDTSVPPKNLPAFIAEIPSAISDTADLYVFGHLLDGNLHLAIVDADEAVTSTVIAMAVRHGGAISAEHGIGQAKNEFLQLVRSARELEMMREIRKAFDPAGVMNPHVLVEK